MLRAMMLTLGMVTLMAQTHDASGQDKLAAEQALFEGLAISADQLKPLSLETALVRAGEPKAVICHADEPAWRQAASLIQAAIAEATGVTLPMMTDGELDEDADGGTNVILLGHLDNNRVVARLYHNFYVCLDTGYTGREGYVIRSVHDPFGTGHNYILVGGSYPEGTSRGAQAFAGLAKEAAEAGSLALGRLLVLEFDETDRAEASESPMTPSARDSAIAGGREVMFTPGRGRSGVAALGRYGIRYHRTGDPLALETYRGLMLALLEYYATDEYINTDGMARYDRDFRDAWTFKVGILWDLIEESGAFSDEERLACTNLLLRLVLECVLYQGYDRPERLQHWANNEDIVHNHNTFPALGLYFVGNYLKRHYDLEAADDWLTVAHGIFNGQKHSSKPLEDAAGYQWLPLIHTMVYSLAEGDLTFFEEGHARDAAKVAMMVMDNAGWESAFGDHSALRAASAVKTTLQKIAWYYRDPEILWGARLRTSRVSPGHEIGQPYHVDLEPRQPAQHVGISISYLPRQCYEHTSRNPTYPTAPNLPFESTFDKLAFRGGLDPDDEYMLLDGFGRGTHMHFDANAIIRFSSGGEPLLVDGEYIKNAPKYHSSLVIIRDGQAELTPAVTGLARADQLDSTAYTRTYLTEYNGTEWTRGIFWRRGEYFLISDDVRALEPGEFTLRCCWRPWGNATLEAGKLTVDHSPMRMVIANADGAACRLETMKTSERWPISRLSQQVSRRMETGDSYRFVNLLHAEPREEARDLGVRRVGDGVIVIERPEGADVVAFKPGTGRLPGVTSDAEILLLANDRFAAMGCTALEDGQPLLRSSAPVSVELAPGEGRGVVEAEGEAKLELRLGAGRELAVGDKTVRADDAGMVTLDLAAGRHTLDFERFEMYPTLISSARETARKTWRHAASPDAATPATAMNPAWQQLCFETPKEALAVLSVESDRKPYGRYGPVDKLFDGNPGGSYNSVMWAAGVTATVVAELAAETEISTVLLREWHMNSGWDIGTRKLEISSDGFARDVRAIEAPFEDVGTQSFGANINTLMQATVDQKARQIRLTLSPARDNAAVYLAEVEVHGTRPGAHPDIHAIATGDLTGDGNDEIVVSSGAGEIAALTAQGQELWTFRTGERSAVRAIACADVNGDGLEEVMYGGDRARLGLLSASGEELWHTQLPEFRGIRGDVRTILAADLDGDGLPEILCGCKNWMYYAHDAKGEMLWSNVTYAHSATVSHADDFDGDGLPEILSGNVYYRLNLIDGDGKRMFLMGNLGPEQTAVSSADVDGDGLPEILVGTDGGELLCYDGDGTQLWTTNLGDKVTRILAVDLTGDGAGEIVCAAESANVFALNLDGSTLWRTALPDGAGDVAVAERGGAPILVAAAGALGVVALSADGTMIGMAATGGRAESVVVCQGQAVVTTDAGEVRAFDLP